MDQHIRCTRQRNPATNPIQRRINHGQLRTRPRVRKNSRPDMGHNRLAHPRHLNNPIHHRSIKPRRHHRRLRRHRLRQHQRLCLRTSQQPARNHHRLRPVAIHVGHNRSGRTRRSYRRCLAKQRFSPIHRQPHRCRPISWPISKLCRNIAVRYRRRPHKRRLEPHQPRRRRMARHRLHPRQHQQRTQHRNPRRRPNI